MFTVDNMPSYKLTSSQAQRFAKLSDIKPQNKLIKLLEKQETLNKQKKSLNLDDYPLDMFYPASSEENNTSLSTYLNDYSLTKKQWSEVERVIGKHNWNSRDGKKQIKDFIKNKVSANRYIGKNLKVPLVKYNDLTDHEVVRNKTRYQSYKSFFFDVQEKAYKDVVKFFQWIRNKYYIRIREQYEDIGTLKFSINVEIGFTKYIIEEDKDIFKTKRFHSTTDFHPITIINTNQIHAGLDEAINNTIEQIDKFLENGSEWKIEHIKDSYLNTQKVKIQTGSSYIEFDKYISSKKVCINTKNEDQRCFFYGLVDATMSDENRIMFKNAKQRGKLHVYEPFFKNFGFDDRDCPIQCEEHVITKYENLIKRNINVLKYEHESQVVEKYYISNNDHNEYIYLLLYTKGDRSHYVYCKDAAKLLFGQINKHKEKLLICNKCMAVKRSNESLDNHVCKKANSDYIPIEKLSKHKELRFTKFGNQMTVPYSIYADFESIIESQEDKTFSGGKHRPCGASFVVIERLNGKSSVYHHWLYRGEDCVVQFLNEINRISLEIYHKALKSNKPMKLSDLQEAEFQKGKSCNICKKDFTDEDVKVRDHCHITGEFRGAAHNSCNLNYQIKKMIPVFFHNLRGYDSRLLIEQIHSSDCHELVVIPNTSEKFISFSMIQQIKESKWDKEKRKMIDVFKNLEIRFVDSWQFLASSLENLAETLPKEKFVHTREYVQRFYNGNEELFKLLTTKNFYPYEYMDSFNRFNESTLPPIECFFSHLKFQKDTYDDEDIESMSEDYDFAKKVFSLALCKNLGDYHDLYLRSDVFILADIFENFRDVIIREFGLDPCQYFTLPSLAWDIMLKHTGKSVYLFNEEQNKKDGGDELDKYRFLEKLKVGGISMVGSLRYCKANNKYMRNFDPSKKSSYIMYIDMNNLYGTAMCDDLPESNFEWREYSDIDNFIKDMPPCISEVDIEIPEEKHDFFACYPPCPEKISIDDDMLSSRQSEEYQKLFKSDLKIKRNNKVEKLVPNLKNKKNYVVHYKLLKKFLDLGCKITKIHRVMTFKESQWIKSFVDNCTGKRKAAKSEFEKDLWKLIINSVYGKSNENVRGRANVKVVTNEDNLIKECSKNTLKDLPNFINEDLCTVNLHKKEVQLNKPIYVGGAILGLSKLYMYEFWYNVLKKKYPDCKLIYTDTDSFIFYIETEDLYKDIVYDKEMRDKFDLSNFNINHEVFKDMIKEKGIEYVKKIIGENKKAYGKMKDECAGIPIREVYAIRAKNYFIEMDDDDVKLTAKGVKKAVAKRFSRQVYKDMIFNDGNLKKMYRKDTMYLLQAKNHRISNIAQEKISLNCTDDKRYILEDNIHTLPHGHYRIKQLKSSV